MNNKLTTPWHIFLKEKQQLFCGYGRVPCYLLFGIKLMGIQFCNYWSTIGINIAIKVKVSLDKQG